MKESGRSVLKEKHGLQRQKETKERLGAALISAGIITEAELIEALRLQLGIEYIDLSKTTIPISMAQVVPKNIAKQFQVVPVRMERDELYLAMSDPMNFYAIEEVKKAVRKKIVPMMLPQRAWSMPFWFFTETKAPQGLLRP
mgnify:CR=1 FL=1